MTVSSSTRRAGPFAGNGVTTAFPFTFKVFATSDIAVYLTDADGVQTLLTSNYTVTLNGDQDASPGGTINYPTVGSPMATGYTLDAVGSLAYTQSTDITNTGRFLPQIIENALDKVTILIQQLLERFARALTYPVGDTAANTLPSATDRADKFLAFDADGGPIALGGTGAATDAVRVSVTPTGNIAATTVQAALAELDGDKIPVRTKPVLGIIGDSRVASAFVSGGLAPATTVRCPPHAPSTWACFLSGGKIKTSSAYNKAVSGSLVSALAGQLSNLLAVSPRCTHVLILTGTNSFAASVSGAAAWADLVAVLATIRAAGLQAIVVMDLPRAIAAWSTAAAQNSYWFNQLIREEAPRYGALVVDGANYLADPASATGDPRTGYYYDSIHPATLGAYYIGLDIANKILALLPDVALPGLTSRADVYNAVNNPLGNVLTNGLFAGTAGTNTSSGGAASGTVADGWNNRTLTGTGTSVASLIARTDKPGNWQQMVQTSGAGTSTYRLSQIANPAITTNYPGSGSVVLECDVDVSSAAGLESMGFSVTNFDGGTVRDGVIAMGSTLIVATYYPYPAAFSGRLRTDPLPYNVLANQLLIRFETQVNTGAATIKVGNVELRPVA
jgi:hypothetical protein